MSNDDVLAAQIKSSIITKIKTQEYLPGELLPSERDFATMYSVSRYLIHDIFDELISQHYLIRVQGKGTFVMILDFICAANPSSLLIKLPP